MVHSQTLHSKTLPEGFVYLSDVCPSIMQDIKYASADNFTGRIVPGYVNGKAILSIEAAKALSAVQQALEEQGLGFLVWDAYRPTQAVDAFLQWKHEDDVPAIKERFYPTMSKIELFQVGFIAPGKSSHSRGSTVDLTIIDKATSKPLDMGTDFDFFCEKSYADNTEISAEFVQNRQFLKKLMLEYGFEYFPQEWWHFTLKDEPFPDQYFNFLVE